MIPEKVKELESYKYIIWRYDHETGQFKPYGFNNKMALHGYLDGCSNPEECVPSLRLKIIHRILCIKDRIGKVKKKKRTTKP